MTQCTTNHPELEPAPPGKAWVTNPSNDDRSGDYVLVDRSVGVSATGELSGELTGAEERVPPPAPVYQPFIRPKVEDLVDY